MALTMTRTRTQTTLTKLVTQLANVKGELAFILQLTKNSAASLESLTVRMVQLEKHQAALVLTLKQFDPTLDITQVDQVEAWRKVFRARTSADLAHRYMANVWRP